MLPSQFQNISPDDVGLVMEFLRTRLSKVRHSHQQCITIHISILIIPLYMGVVRSTLHGCGLLNGHIMLSLGHQTAAELGGGESGE